MCSTDISSITPGKVYTQKELVLLETLISEFHNKYYIPDIQKWHLILHVLVLLELITVTNNDMRHLNLRAKNMMFYAVVIINSGYYQVLHIKYNLITTVAVGLYPLREFN